MSIKPGDLARVIGSALGPKGSSVGCIVRVLVDPAEFYSIPHTLHGRIRRCELVRGTNQLVTEFGGIGQQADFAEDWLVRIDPDELKENDVEKKELEV